MVRASRRRRSFGVMPTHPCRHRHRRLARPRARAGARARRRAAGAWSIDARGADALEARAPSWPPRPSVDALAGDVTDPEHRAALVAAAGARIDLLVNNASLLGPSPQPPLADYPLDELERVYRVNVLAPLALVQAALAARCAPGAAIVNVTSDAAVEAYEGWGGYGSSKAALEQLTRVLAAEHPELRVYAVDPGDMSTQMHQEAFPGEDISDRPPPEDSVPGPARADRGRPRRAGATRRARPAPAVSVSRARVRAARAPRGRTSRRRRAGSPATTCGMLVAARRRALAHARFRDLPDRPRARRPARRQHVGDDAGRAPARRGRRHRARRSTPLVDVDGAGRMTATSAGSSSCAGDGAVPRRPRRRAARRCPAAAGRAARAVPRRAAAVGRRSCDCRRRCSSYLARHGAPIRYRYVARAGRSPAYQTVFATEPGSAEMPSAGRPFSRA